MVPYSRCPAVYGCSDIVHAASNSSQGTRFGRCQGRLRPLSQRCGRRSAVEGVQWIRGPLSPRVSSTQDTAPSVIPRKEDKEDNNTASLLDVVVLSCIHQEGPFKSGLDAR